MRKLPFLLAGLGLVPTASWAHGSAAGLGSFSDGFLHPLLAPAHLAALIALALLVGRQGLRRPVHELQALVPGLIVGALAAGVLGDPAVDWALWLGSLLVALVIVADLRLPPWARCLAAGGIGVLLGIGSGDAALQGSGRWASLAGSAVAAVLVVADVGIAVEMLLRRWKGAVTQVGLRVLASWLSATVVLMLALEGRRWMQGG